MKLPELGKVFMFLVITGITIFIAFLIITNFTKKTEEGFYPLDVERMKYGQAGRERYNELSDTQDPFNVFGVIPLDGTGQEVVDGVLQTATYDASGPKIRRGSAMDIRFDNPKNFMPLPVNKELIRRIKLCESIKDWKCEAFRNNEFNQFCGICVENGETSRGDKIKFGGLYIDPQLRADTVADAKRANKEPELIPSVGKCPANKFILYRPDCDYRKDRYQCSQANNFKDANAVEKCVSCLNPPTGKPTFIYVGKRGNDASDYAQFPKPYKFDARLRLAVSLDEARIKLIRLSNNSTIEGRALKSREFEFILKNTYENEQFSLSVEFETFKPYKFSGGEMDALNAIVADNKSKVISANDKNNDATKIICERESNRIFTLNDSDLKFYGCAKEKCCQRIAPTIKRKFAIVAQFESLQNSRRVHPFDTAISRISGLVINADEGPPRYGSISGSPVFSKLVPAYFTAKLPKNRFWVWDADDTKAKVDFAFIMPVSFLEVTFPVDAQLCPTGPLVSSVEADERLRTGACMKLINGAEQGPGTYTDECIKSLFLEGGCKKEGTGFPNTQGKLDNMSFSLDPNKTRTYKSMEEILDKVQEKSQIAGAEYSFNTDLKELEDASRYCYGSFEFNPCKGPMEKTGPQSVECLDFLFRNAGKTTTGIGPTYHQSSNRSSGTGRIPSKPIEYCTRLGNISPMNEMRQPNLAAVEKANSLGSVQNIRNYYDELHKTANYSLIKEKQYGAMGDCYGIRVQKDKSCNDVALEDPTQIPDGSEFELVPSISPGSRVINLMGALIGQANLPPSAALTAKFVSKEIEANIIQIISKSGPPTNGVITIDGFKLKIRSDDGSFNFKQDSTWKIVESVAGNPGEVSIQSVSKPGFFIYFNVIDRTVGLNNDIARAGKAMSFRII